MCDKQEETKLNYTIRSIRSSDAEAVYNLRIMDGVRENTMSLFSQRVEKTEEFIKKLSGDDHVMVAEIEEKVIKKVVGIVGLNVIKQPGSRHCGYLVISVDKNFQGLGIGKALMEKIIDIADNWLMLIRIELGVFTDNIAAINLYKYF
ncbi:GNAT family N-acetyltransferase [Clostridium grantii]|uniref:Putative acetyltransferase n=1 Tax=Clostridium grantii DSM 8605 TaxID=1121316 RepID=A0A1M5Y669_9CLOT|nr:putative acetyltransferase [Clostridium grantii DSM 8605]